MGPSELTLGDPKGPFDLPIAFHLVATAEGALIGQAEAGELKRDPPLRLATGFTLKRVVEAGK
jgi:hypothetical protein